MKRQRAAQPTSDEIRFTLHELRFTSYASRNTLHEERRALAEHALVPPKIRNFRDLEVWQLGRKIVLRVYELTRGFPRAEHTA